jgi:hypothetical protein
MCRMSIPRTAVVGVKDPTTYILRVFVSIKFFSVPRDGTGTDNIPRRLLTTLPNSGSLHLYLSIRRYSDFRDRDSLDLESRLERHLCVRSYEFSSSRLRTGLVVQAKNGRSYRHAKLLEGQPLAWGNIVACTARSAETRRAPNSSTSAHSL